MTFDEFEIAYFEHIQGVETLDEDGKRAFLSPFSVDREELSERADFVLRGLEFMGYEVVKKKKEA